MGRQVTSANEKKITDLLFAKMAESETPADAPTIDEERDELARQAASLKEKDEAQKRRYASLVETATQAAKTVESGDSDQLEAKGAQVLKAVLERMIGKGGFSIQREEFRPVKAHKDAGSDRYSVTDEAFAAYHVDILLPSGGTKLVKCVVAYDASQTESKQFDVKDMFFDALDNQRPLTEKGLKAYLKGEPSEAERKAQATPSGDERPIVYFNSDETVVDYEEIEVPAPIRTLAVKALREAGFEVEQKYMDRTASQTFGGKLTMEVYAQPERHDEMRGICAQLVKKWDDKSWFDRSTEDHGTYGQETMSPGDDWFERTKQKEDMPNQPHDWFERSLEKPGEESVASSAYGGTKMLRFEKKRLAQAKKADAEKDAEKGVRRARREAKADDKEQAESVVDRMERLAGRRAERPFR